MTYNVICDFCGNDRASGDHRCTCIPDGFWSRRDVAEALHQRDARTLLRLLLHSTPLTHEALAYMCGVTQSTVTRALNGTGLTRPDVVARVLAGLGAPSPPPAGPSSFFTPLSVHRPWERRLGDEAADTLAQVRTLLDQAPPDAVLTALEADVDLLCRSYAHTPLTELHSQIVHRRRHALVLLPTLAHPDQSRRVHTAAARLVGLQAHVALDTGSYTTAAVHADAARTLADRICDPALQAWTHSLHSLIAYWDGRYTDAQSAAEAGLTYGAADSNLARLHALRARAAAAHEDAAMARTAIAAAEDHAHLEVLPGILGFPAPKVHAYAGTTLLSLNTAADRQRGITHAERAITLYSTGSDRSVGDLLAARLDLTNAHLQNRDLDGALEQVTIITAVPPAYRTASITKRARRLAPLVAGAGTALDRRIRDLMAEFTRAPGPGPMPR